MQRAGSTAAKVRAAARELIEKQREDGGWAATALAVAPPNAAPHKECPRFDEYTWQGSNLQPSVP